MEEQWINEIRKKMASHQAPVPHGLWEDIEAALPPRQPAVRPHRKRIWLWTAATGCAAAAVLLLFFVLPDRSDVLTATTGNGLTASLKDLYKHKKDLNINTTQELDLIEAEKGGEALALISPVMQNKLEKTVPAAVVMTSVGEGTPENPKSDDERKKIESTVNFTDSAKDGEISASEKTNHTTRRTAAAVTRSRQPMLAQVKPSKRKKTTLNLYAANLTHTSSRQGGYGEFVAGTVLPHDFPGESGDADTPVRQIIYNNLGRKVDTRTRHKLPVKMGLTFRIPLYRRWHLETGVTYTYLSSELTSGSAESYYTADQKLQYLGVPLHVSYDIWKNKTWNLYAAAGGTLEKCIYGKTVTDFNIDGQTLTTHEQRFFEKPLQTSVDGTLGAQLNFSPRWGFYAEPGVCYYFDNGSDVRNIYKDKPFNFNFKMGVRFSL